MCWRTVGPVRKRQLIHLVAFLVALNLCVGVVALFASGGSVSATSREERTAQASDPLPLADPAGVADGARQGGVLAGGYFRQRRGAGDNPSRRAGSDSGSAAPATRPTGTPSPSSTGRPTAATGRPSTSSSKPIGTSAPGRSTTSATTGAATGPANPPAGGGGPASSAPAGRHNAPNGAVPKVVVDDRAGDTVVDGTGEPRADARADIVRSEAFYTSNAIIFTVQTGAPVDPSKDPNWESDSTFVTWELDTNDDGAVDYEVQFAFFEGAPIAGVSRPGDSDGESVCEAEAAYTAERYAVAVDPACAGLPASVSYRVTINYDTDPKNEDAAVVKDVAPDGGMSRPVARPAG